MSGPWAVARTDKKGRIAAPRFSFRVVPGYTGTAAAVFIFL